MEELAYQNMVVLVVVSIIQVRKEQVMQEEYLRLAHINMEQEVE